MKLTKKQALQMFLEFYEGPRGSLPCFGPRGYEGPRGDVSWKREAWNNFTDSLCKDRQISSHQYDTWTNPF